MPKPNSIVLREDMISAVPLTLRTILKDTEPTINFFDDRPQILDHVSIEDTEKGSEKLGVQIVEE